MTEIPVSISEDSSDTELTTMQENQKVNPLENPSSVIEINLK